MHGIGWFRAGITCYCSLLLLMVGCQKEERKEASQPFQAAIEKQRKLPAAEITALQDLRLLGAVQSTYFSRKQRYATPDDLKTAGFLDAGWPRSAVTAYKLVLKLGDNGERFEIFADPVEQGLGYYRIDETQVVRTERQRRPTPSSAVF